MNIPMACRRERVIEGPGVAVDRCGCGTLHVTLGMLTLRLSPAGFEGIADALLAARRTLAERTRVSTIRLPVAEEDADVPPGGGVLQ